MEIRPELDPRSGTPIYRQLSTHLQRMIETGDVVRGDRLPPTRDLAAQLGLNRTTVSAAYEVLETDGLITGQVGRGSFIAGRTAPASSRMDWVRFFESSPPSPPKVPSFSGTGVISFAASRPCEDLFPLADL